MVGVFEKEASSSSHALDEAAGRAPCSCRCTGRGRSSRGRGRAASVVAAEDVRERVHRDRGGGVLGLPYTFMRTGWAAGLAVLLGVAALTFHCMMLLVRTRRRLEPCKIASFGDLGMAVSGPLGRLAVDSMIVLSQAGFCVGYLIFICNSLAHLLPSLPKPSFVLAMLPFQLALNSVRSLTLLAPISIFADLVDLGAMGVVLGQDLSVLASAPPPVRACGSPAALLYGVGVAVYAFEGIGMVLPLEAEAADKPRFGRALALSMAFIAAMYGLFGALGYLAFGDDTRDIITTNLGPGWLTVLVQVGLCVNLFFTMPVMMNPVYEVAERWACGKRYCWWLRWPSSPPSAPPPSPSPTSPTSSPSSAAASASSSASCSPPPSTSRCWAPTWAGPGSPPTSPSSSSASSSPSPGRGPRSPRSYSRPRSHPNLFLLLLLARCHPS
uniref:Amino acid transporter transmembrane domain-containing protein n=1 Tax=Ananas comosus var. bracteatus TaxID=296719 RepID=A0A6V7QNW6_ANACO|nr:unnamed protein product [Ananas comosus var. bracteatus]